MLSQVSNRARTRRIGPLGLLLIAPVVALGVVSLMSAVAATLVRSRRRVASRPGSSGRPSTGGDVVLTKFVRLLAIDPRFTRADAETVGLPLDETRTQGELLEQAERLGWVAPCPGAPDRLHVTPQFHAAHAG